MLGNLVLMINSDSDFSEVKKSSCNKNKAEWRYDNLNLFAPKKNVLSAHFAHSKTKQNK